MIFIILLLKNKCFKNIIMVEKITFFGGMIYINQQTYFGLENQGDDIP